VHGRGSEDGPAARWGCGSDRPGSALPSTTSVASQRFMSPEHPSRGTASRRRPRCRGFFTLPPVSAGPQRQDEQQVAHRDGGWTSRKTRACSGSRDRSPCSTAGARSRPRPPGRPAAGASTVRNPPRDPLVGRGRVDRAGHALGADDAPGSCSARARLPARRKVPNSAAKVPGQFDSAPAFRRGRRTAWPTNGNTCEAGQARHVSRCCGSCSRFSKVPVRARRALGEADGEFRGARRRFIRKC